MKILVDTNVILDIILSRKPWYTDAALIFSLTKQKLIKSFVSATTVTDIFYISKKDLGNNNARESLKKLFQYFIPATVTDKDIYKALNLDWDDFEDSVQYIIGESFSVDYIVTRNTHDFTASDIKVVTPEQFLQIINEEDEE